MISVIIPAYNAGRFLAQTVQSVQSQTYAAWELIIVDDGSKDDTLAIAQEISRQDDRISAVSQQNAGVSTARNLGLAKSNSTYPYVLWLDNDDILVPDALQTLLALLESAPEFSAACGPVQDIDAAGCVIANYHRFEPLTQRRGIEGFRLARRGSDAPLVFGDLCFHNHIISPGQVLVRRSAIENAGSFDVSLAYTEDYDMWLRLTMQVGPIAVTHEPVLLYRHHTTNASGNRANVKRGAADFRWNLLTHSGMSPEQKRAARAGYFYNSLVRGEFALFYLRSGKIKQGVKEAALGIRGMLYFVRDLARLRKATALSSRPISR
ncbi:MAG: glycosyltransferase family 2 protein [Janthinobacterium lividum]